MLTRAAELPAGGFTDLLDSAAVDSLVTERGLRQPFFRIVQDAVPVSGVTRSVVAGSRTISDLADADAIAAAHSSGATIVLNSLHRIWPPIVEFCRALAADLGHPVQCNAYLTPAGNAQGFAFHHDTHDVFVLQVEGSKHWQVHPPVLDLPTKSQPRSGADLVAEGQAPLLDVVLEPGDALYLPRGYVHAARTTDRPSLHLTIGVLAVTWLDVLKDAVAELGADEVGLRRSLPFAAGSRLAGTSGADAAAGLLKQAAEWLAALPPDQVAEVARKRLAAAARPRPLRPTAQAAVVNSLDESTVVRCRRGVAYRLAGDDERVSLTAAGKRVEFPAVATVMLRRLLDGPVSSGALAAGDPECDVADALVVVRRLLREGLLEADR